jgi:hypothetical protein
MERYVGIDVSLELSSLCAVDQEAKSLWRRRWKANQTLLSASYVSWALY